MSMTVSGQDMKEDGWRMNFEQNGSFRTLAGVILQVIGR